MYQKIRFSLHATSNDPEHCTAGLIVESDKLKSMTMGEISRMFPNWETVKMRGVLQVSRQFDSFNAAFNHQFSELD